MRDPRPARRAGGRGRRRAGGWRPRRRGASRGPPGGYPPVTWPAWPRPGAGAGAAAGCARRPAPPTARRRSRRGQARRRHRGAGVRPGQRPPPDALAVRCPRTRRGDAAAGRPAAPARPKVRSVPCGDARTGSPDRPESASAGGTRGSSPVGGCSAGTCACSPELQDHGRRSHARRGALRGDDPRYGGLVTGSNPHRRPHLADRPCQADAPRIRDRLWGTCCGSPRHPVSVSSPAFPAAPGPAHDAVHVGGVHVGSVPSDDPQSVDEGVDMVGYCSRWPTAAEPRSAESRVHP
jgi:hypothetical protein